MNRRHLELVRPPRCPYVHTTAGGYRWYCVSPPHPDAPQEHVLVRLQTRRPGRPERTHG